VVKTLVISGAGDLDINGKVLAPHANLVDNSSADEPIKDSQGAASPGKVSFEGAAEQKIKSENGKTAETQIDAKVEARQKVKVWQVAPGSFYLVAWYRGTWTTYAGVPSPNCSMEPGDSFGLPVAQADGSGPWSGWVAFSFDATAYTPTFGYLDTFDDGGTMADVLLGYYFVPGTDTPLQVGSRHDADSALFNYFTIDDWDSLAAIAAHYVYRNKNQRFVWTWSPEAGDSLTGNIVVTR
jgi:hypothetical protein